MEKNKKNLMLLTIAFLLVAVVGATFAYFTAQVGEGANVDINADTDTVDSLMFNNNDSSINIEASQSNFNDTSISICAIKIEV